MRKILVTGAQGQIGSELVPALRERHSAGSVVASYHRTKPKGDDGLVEHLDCTDSGQIQDVVRRHDIGVIYHLAALLSAVAEEKPQAAWDANMGSLYNVLEAARRHDCALFFPSSIGAFGPNTPKLNTPQDTIQRPNTMYGVTKVSGELLCDYYAARYGIDARGLRFPGLISHVAEPGGGTTDYAVEIFYHAIRQRRYTCFLRPDTRLDMMYMPDAVRAACELMDAAPNMLRHRNAFNVTAMSITPEELAAAIRDHIPDFVIDYEVDPVRQAIADSWPQSMDDGEARAQWGWSPQFDLGGMTADMLKKLRRKFAPRIDDAP
jgi:nucleoside-diphosphate-sugar epimerase